jgi:hypothetical protein
MDQKAARLAALAGWLAVRCPVGLVRVGWLSDRRAARRTGLSRLRPALALGGLACSTVTPPVPVVQDRAAAIALPLASRAAFGAFTSNRWAMPRALAAPRWTSLPNRFAILSGIAAARLSAPAVRAAGRVCDAFLTVAACALAGAVLSAIAGGVLEEVDWEGL